METNWATLYFSIWSHWQRWPSVWKNHLSLSLSLFGCFEDDDDDDNNNNDDDNNDDDNNNDSDDDTC